MADIDIKEFYIRKVGTLGKISIWLVDGTKIRTFNNEFTNFGHHYTFSFIPEYEFWVEKESKYDERNFFIDHMLAEWQGCRKGLTFDQALEVANKKEKAERLKAGDLSKVMDKEGHPEIQNVYVKQLGKTADDIFVWVVKGRLVRSVFYMDYVQGGHDYVYKFVPHNEVWLDDDLLPEEWPYVLTHELHERKLMKEKSWAYNKAHASASQLEWRLRNGPKRLKSVLKKLGCTDSELLTNLGLK